MKPQRQDVKAILDNLLGRTINLNQANQQIQALGLSPYHGGLVSVPQQFIAGTLSYDEVYQTYGV